MANWFRSILGGKASEKAAPAAAVAGGGSATPMLDKVPAALRARAVDEMKNLAATPQVQALAAAGGGSAYRSAKSAPRAAGVGSGGSYPAANKPARSILTAKVRGNMSARCQQAARDNGFIRSLMRRKCEHIAGDGFLVRIRTGETDAHKAWDKLAQAYAKRELKRMKFWRYMQWAVRSWDTCGPALLLKIRNADGVCRVQAIDTDLLVTPDANGKPMVNDDGSVVVLPDGGKICGGVETDPFGEVVAYHVAEWGDTEALLKEAKGSGKPAIGGGFVWAGSSGSYGIGTVRRIPAEMVIFLLPEAFGNPEHHSHEPLLQATLSMAELQGRYLESVAIASVMATCFGLIITAANPAQEKAVDDVSLEDQSVDMAAAVAAGEDPEIVLEAGLVKYIGPKGAVNQIKPEFPQTGAGDYVKGTAQFMSAEHGLPAMLSMFDMQGTTAANGRMILSLTYRGLDTPMRVLADDGWEEIVRFVVGTAILRGALPVPPAKAAWVDGIIISTNYAPVVSLSEEAEAWTKLVGQTFTTRDEATRQMGFGDWEEVARARHDEMLLEHDLQITPAEMPGAKRPGDDVAGGGADAGEDKNKGVEE